MSIYIHYSPTHHIERLKTKNLAWQFAFSSSFDNNRVRFAEDAAEFEKLKGFIKAHKTNDWAYEPAGHVWHVSAEIFTQLRGMLPTPQFRRHIQDWEKEPKSPEPPEFKTKPIDEELFSSIDELLGFIYGPGSAEARRQGETLREAARDKAEQNKKAYEAPPKPPPPNPRDDFRETFHAFYEQYAHKYYRESRNYRYTPPPPPEPFETDDVHTKLVVIFKQCGVWDENVTMEKLFKRAARKLHPDVPGGSEEAFKTLNGLWQVYK